MSNFFNTLHAIDVCISVVMVISAPIVMWIIIDLGASRSIKGR
jgi:hypothetical protein